MCFGSSRKVSASQLNFSVEPVLPENQLDKAKTYFDIKLANSNDQTLEIKVTNHATVAITVETSLNRATTNINGIVEYDQGVGEKDSSLKVDIEELVVIDQPKLLLKPSETRILTLKIKVPTKKFTGVLAGGLLFKEYNNEEQSEPVEGGLAIKNEYAYLVALLLHGQLKQEEMPAELQLTKAGPSQVNVRNVIFGNLQNPQPKYLNKLIVSGKVTRKDKSEVLYERKNENIQMAPNSNFDFTVPLSGDKLQPGEYTIFIEAQAEKEKWELKKDFTITAEKAKKLNEEDVTIPVTNYFWWYVLGAVIISIAGLISMGLFIRSERRKKNKRRRISSAKNQKFR